MQLFKLAFFLLLSSSTFADPQTAAAYNEMYTELNQCCDANNCQKACTWLKDNPQLKVTSGGRMKVNRGRFLRILQSSSSSSVLTEEEIDDLCCKNDQTSTPKTNGDPHFTMFGGHKFDFHGACDLVFLDNPEYNHGQGMKIHMRTKIVRWWSYVQTVVVQIGNDTLEVMGGTVQESKYWVNGEAGPPMKGAKVLPFKIGGHKVRYRVPADTKFQFKIFLENNQEIVLRSVKGFMMVELPKHTRESFGSSRGVLGTYEDGLMMARNGTTILEDPVQFGMEWQVRHDEPMLFHNVEGVQHPIPCEMPLITQRRLGEGRISHEQAALVCKDATPVDIDDCIYDVMATDDLDLAGAY